MRFYETVKYPLNIRINMSDKIVTLNVRVGRDKHRMDGKEYYYYRILIPMNKIRILSDTAKIAIYPAEWINESD